MQRLTLGRRRAALNGFIAMASLGVLILAGCAPAETGEGEVPTSSDSTIVHAIPAYPASFAMDAPGGADTWEVLNATNANLIRNPYVPSEADPNSLTQDLYNWEGVLAESYEVSPDGLVYTFHLRRDVLSQAGNPFTAEDVLYSFERKWNAETSVVPRLSLPALADPSVQLERIDDYTVAFTLEAAGHGLPFLSIISKFLYNIYDSTLLKEHATPEDPYAVQWSAQNGNYGYGAYNIASYRQGEEIVLEANPNYPLGEVPIKRITMRVVADGASRALLLQSGDVDAAIQLLPADIVNFEGNPDVSTFSPDTNMFTYMQVNTTAAPFDDPAVREAFFYAIPYEQIIDQTYRGRANLSSGYMDASNPKRIIDGLIEPSYDPEKSRELLESAGVTTPVHVELMMASATPDLEEAAIQMQSFTADTGFEFSIAVLPTPTAEERTRMKDYDAHLVRDFVISYESAPYTLELFNPRNNPDRNSTGWGPEEYYAAVDAGVAAGDSQSDEAMRYWHEAELMWQDAYHMWQIANVLPVTAMSSDLTGFAHRSDNIVDWAIVAFK